MGRAAFHAFGFGSRTLGEFPTTLGVTVGNIVTGVCRTLNGNYYLFVTPPNVGDPAKYIQGPKVLASGGPFVFHFGLRVDNISPAPDLVFFGATFDKALFHLSLLLTSAGAIRLRDADDNTVADSPAGIIRADTWHKIDVFLVHGDPGSAVIRVDNAEIFNVSGQNFDGGVDMCTVHYGQAGGGASPCTMDIDSGVSFEDCDQGADDFLIDWDLGDWQRLLASATPDVGDDLTTGQWDDLAIPYDASTARYTVANKFGVVTTVTGPYGDARIGDNWIPIVAWWHFYWSSSLATPPFRARYGDIPYTTPTTDGTTEVSLGSSASLVHTIILSQDAADMPDSGEWAQYGMAVPAGLGADATMAGCGCFMLYEVPFRGITVGGGIPGRDSGKEILVG